MTMYDKEHPDLDLREQMYVREYLANGFNAMQAALSAGYSEATARNIAGQWIRHSRQDSGKPHLWDIFNKERTRRISHLDVTHDRIMQEYARCAFFDPAKMYDEDGALLELHQMDEDTRRAIAGIDIHDTAFFKKMIKVKTYDRLRALDSLARVTGMNQDNVNVHHRFGDLLDEVSDETENDQLIDEATQQEEEERD